MKISNKSVGNNSQCFIIAEGCDNHMGNLDVAKEMSRLAKISGADAIKFQTFDAESLAKHDAPKASYQIKNSFKKKVNLKCLKN